MVCYDHTFAVQAFPVKPKIIELNADQVGQATAAAGAQILNNLRKSFPDLESGDVEIVSHSLTRVGGTLVGSFLLRQPKK